MIIQIGHFYICIVIHRLPLCPIDESKEAIYPTHPRDPLQNISNIILIALNPRIAHLLFLASLVFSFSVFPVMTTSPLCP